MHNASRGYSSIDNNASIDYVFVQPKMPIYKRSFLIRIIKLRYKLQLIPKIIDVPFLEGILKTFARTKNPSSYIRFQG